MMSLQWYYRVPVTDLLARGVHPFLPVNPPWGGEEGKRRRKEDERERGRKHKEEDKEWRDGDALCEICRVQVPAIPNNHIVPIDNYCHSHAGKYTHTARTDINSCPYIHRVQGMHHVHTHSW